MVYMQLTHFLIHHSFKESLHKNRIINFNQVESTAGSCLSLRVLIDQLCLWALYSVMRTASGSEAAQKHV
jgi:hypothetical protein